MNFLKNRSLLREILKQGDLMHTINGGVRETYFEIQHDGDDILIKVSNPSISPEAFNFTIHNNNLIIHVVYTSQPEADQKPLLHPLFSRVVQIPYFVDASKIEATFENDVFRIHLPYNRQINKEPQTLNVKFLDN